MAGQSGLPLDEHSQAVDAALGHCAPDDDRRIACGEGLIVVCFTNRSGSTLLCSALAALGLAGEGDGFNNYEYLNSNRVLPLITRTVPHDFEELLQGIIDRGRGPRGWTTLKASPGQLRHLIEHGVWDRLTPGPTVLVARRRDVVRQAVSLVRARQDGQWTSLHDRKPHTRHQYDGKLVREVSHSLVELNRQLDWTLALHGVESDQYLFEEMAASPNRLAARLSERFGITEAPDWSVLPIESQRSFAKHAWTVRAKTELLLSKIKRRSSEAS